MQPKTIGTIMILCSALMWSVEPILAKLSYSNSDVLHSTAIRTFVVAIIAMIYVLVSYNGNLKIGRVQLGALFYTALAATLFAELIYMYAFTKIPVVNAVLIAHLQPVFIALMGYVALKNEKLTKYDYLGMMFMLIAGLFVTTKSPENLFQLRIGAFGDLLVLFAAIAWATTAIVMKKFLMNVNPGAIVFYRYGIASMAFLVYLLMTSYITISNIYQILVGVVIGIGMILYYESMKRLKAAQVGSLELASPFFAAALGFFIFGEMLTQMQLFGMLLLLVGIYFLSRREKS